MTVHYYTNEYNIPANAGLYCAGCGSMVRTGDKAERHMINGRVEVRHIHCRPKGMPRPPRPRLRDSRGRFMAACGIAVGDELRWTRLGELPLGSQVRGTGNRRLYTINGPGTMKHEGRDAYDRVGMTYGFGEVGAYFTVERVGP